MRLNRALTAARVRLITPVGVATLVLVIALTAVSVWSLRPDPPADPNRIIAAGNRATGKAGKPRKAEAALFEIADLVCSSLRHRQSLVEAQSFATRQLGSTPKDGLTFVFVTIDNRCRDVDDDGLIDNDEGKLNKNYR